MKAHFTGSQSKDISNTIYRTPYKLYGLTQISLKHKKPLAFESDISEDFNLKVESEGIFDSFGMMYIIAGNAPKMLCSHCGSGFVAYGSVCVNTCPLGTTSKTYKDGGVCCIGTAVSTSKQSNSRSSTTKTTGYGSRKSGYQTSRSARYTTSGTTSGSSRYRATGGSTSTQATNGASRQTTTRNYGTKTRYQARTPMTSGRYGKQVQTRTHTTTTRGSTMGTTRSGTTSRASTSSQGSTTRQTTTARPTAIPKISHTSQPTEECSENAFFNGFECVCEVGYGYINGKCSALNIVLATPVVINMGHGSSSNNTKTVDTKKTVPSNNNNNNKKEEESESEEKPIIQVLPPYIPPKGNCS